VLGVLEGVGGGVEVVGRILAYGVRVGVAL
jgi:hypothetical protein